MNGKRHAYYSSQHWWYQSSANNQQSRRTFYDERRIWLIVVGGFFFFYGLQLEQTNTEISIIQSFGKKDLNIIFGTDLVKPCGTRTGHQLWWIKMRMVCLLLKSIGMIGSLLYLNGNRSNIIFGVWSLQSYLTFCYIHNFKGSLC